MCKGACVDFQDDWANCGSCGHACTTGVPCRSSVCCSAVRPVCGGTCCAGGSACCGDLCPTEHENGLGQVFFDCNPLGTYTHDSALSAADAWTTTGTTYDGTTLCGASCIGRQTTTTCAVWCWAGGWQGQVALGSTLVCQCPGATGAVTATWN